MRAHHSAQRCIFNYYRIFSGMPRQDPLSRCLCCSLPRVFRPSFDLAQLLAAIANNDREVSPSMLYAAAAVLEGCSFVNGGSQNTMCGALLKLAEVRARPVEG